MRACFRSIPIGLGLSLASSMPGQTMLFFREFTTPVIQHATGIAADGLNIYVAGGIRRSQVVQSRAGLSKYDSFGNELWTREIIAPPVSGPHAGGVAVSKILTTTSGLYVLASIIRPDQPWQSFLRRYSSDGEELWTHLVEGAGVLAVDANGVYVAGNDPSNTAYLRKYSPDGAEQWIRKWGDANNLFYTQAVTVDTTGIYVFGIAGSTQFQLARKYDLGGKELWTRQLDRFYYGTFARAEPTGFYLAALEFGSGGVSLRKYNSDGTALWARSIGVWNDAGSHGPPDVVADATGVYVAGGNNLMTSLPGHCRSGSAGDSFLRKYGQNGDELWTRQFGTAEASLANGVAVADSGVYVAGQSGSGRFDVFEPPNAKYAAFLAKFEKHAATFVGLRPRISPDCVVNAASYVGGGVAPGEIVTIFGSGIGPAEPVSMRVADDGRLATTLAETRILFNGVPAPLLYVSDTQSSAIVPYAVSGRASVDVQLEYAGSRSEVVTVPVLEARPGIFSLDGSGHGQAAILNEDGTLNSPSNPARRGSIISLFATGGGEHAPGAMDGQIVGGDVPVGNLPISVLFDFGAPSKQAEVLYAGGVPGFVAGLLQLSLRVPTNVLATGDAVQFVLLIGSHWTGFQVTVAVR